MAEPEFLTAAQFRELTKVPKNKSRIRRSPPEKRTCDGIVFDSIAEMKQYHDLKFKQIAGLIYDLEIHPRWQLHAYGGDHIGDYEADFQFKLPRGELVVQEVKSDWTRKDDPSARLYSWKVRHMWAEYKIKVEEVVR